MLLPAVVWFAVFCYQPMYGVLLAFKDYKFNMGILHSPWVGLKYFNQFLFAAEFWNVIRNTLVISVLKLACSFPAPIILALLLNEVQNMRFKRVVQTVSYLPHFVSWVVVYSLLTIVFTPYGGLVNSLRTQVFGLEAMYYMGEKQYFYPMAVLSDIWKGVGWGTIVYLSAITSVSPELYEAAIVDGAGRLRCAWHVTLPGIRPTIAILFILATGGILNANTDQVLLMQQPANMAISQIVDTYVLKIGIREGRFGYATAIGLFKSVFSAALMFTANAISRRVGEISIW
ncbi:MAG: ABC transporter permease subunit [Oscillospiraceae bacterium]|jgi:putative aldouronate transport system permease protein|nr:ABC transporter permease subunit [Oscillospiraceae bacterium]